MTPTHQSVSILMVTSRPLCQARCQPVCLLTHSQLGQTLPSYNTFKQRRMSHAEERTSLAGTQGAQPRRAVSPTALGSGLSGAKPSNQTALALTAADLIGPISSTSSAADEYELREEISQQLRRTTLSDKILHLPVVDLLLSFICIL
jgi:hypothetical protein